MEFADWICGLTNLKNLNFKQIILKSTNLRQTYLI